MQRETAGIPHFEQMDLASILLHARCLWDILILCGYLETSASENQLIFLDFFQNDITESVLGDKFTYGFRSKV